MANLELKIPPLALWAGFALAVWAGAHWLPAANLPLPGHRAGAIALLLAGIAVALAGVMEFTRAGTTVNPMAPARASAAVHTGVYRWTRNPMYLGMAATLLALALWWASIPGVVLVAAFCLYITRFQIQPEERALLGLFGEQFANYMAQVRRWI